MRLLVFLHRWWGVAFCLLFAMWFASGIVMHFVPFPARGDAGGSGDRLDLSRAAIEWITRDQWTVGGDYDPDRPLKRATLGDADGTQIYVSSTTGAVVLVTTHAQRALNYFGSIPH